MVLAADMYGLIVLVFLLGLRHGFDPDHLVAIDGLARSSAHRQARISRWSGVFFSLGHGVVVTLVGLAVAVAAADWRAPSWLEHAGAGISIGVLLALGSANLLVVVRAPAGRLVAPVGLRGRWLADRLAAVSHPAVIALIGAAFALSFDTISHALVFSLTGASMAGWTFATGLGLVFTLGMIVTDALNGWWIATLLRGADRRAAAAARIMGVSIALLCLALAGVGLAKYADPLLDESAGQFAPAVSIAASAILALAYLVARRVRACTRLSPREVA